MLLVVGYLAGVTGVSGVTGGGGGGGGGGCGGTGTDGGGRDGSSGGGNGSSGGGNSSSGGANGSSGSMTPLSIDCSSAQGCDTWHPASSPFKGEYDYHTCTAWKDSDAAPIHESIGTNCKNREGADPGSKNDRVASCSTANRVGGCMIADEYTCVVDYFYADPETLPGSRADAGAVQTMCEQAGGKYVP